MTDNILDFRLPQMGATMESGTVIRWAIAVGDTVSEGDLIMELETDKTALDIEAPANGSVAEILVAEGEEAAVGDVLARFLTSDPLSKENSGGRIMASPSAKRIAREAGLDLSELAEQLGNRRIRRKDVLAAIEGGGGEELIAPSGMRSAIAARVTESKQTVLHFYLNSDCNFDAVLALRAGIEDRDDYSGQKPTLTDFIIRAVAVAMQQTPGINMSWTDNGIKQHASIDIGLSIAVDDGLVNVAIKAAAEKTLAEIASESAAIRERARSGHLAAADLEPGTFTISNLGMFGVQSFTAIIDAPQSGILAVGRVEERAIVRDGAVVAANVCTFTLSVDHRVVDGALAARFLVSIRAALAAPVEFLL